jgi:hypothetical protein
VSDSTLHQDQYCREDGRRHQRLHVHEASLTSNLAALGRIGNWLSTFVHVAQTARREVHSGLISSLKETHQADPERRKEYKSPTPWRSETEEDASE